MRDTEHVEEILDHKLKTFLKNWKKVKVNIFPKHNNERALFNFRRGWEGKKKQENNALSF